MMYFRSFFRHTPGAYRQRSIQLFVSFALATLLIGLVPLGTHAQEPDTTDGISTSLEISLPLSIKIGERFIVTVQLKTALEPQPGAIDNEAIELFIDGNRERRTRTDEFGTAVFSIPGGRAAGSYQLTAHYAGTSDLAASEATANLSIEPATVRIQTVPEIAGLKFSLGDNIAESNEAGIVEFQVVENKSYHLEFVGSDHTESRISLDRWGDEEFEPGREVEVNGDISLEAGFEIYYPVKIDFVDLDGNPVPPEQITAVTMTSNHGKRITLTDDLEVWLQASRVTRRRNGLENVPALWSIKAVEINGTSVVNRNEQRFELDSAAEWHLELLLYSAHVTARDAFFRFPIGKGVEVQYPDGSTKVFPFNSDGEVYLFSMPRGNYVVKVVGASGMAPASPVALTKDQEVDLLVLSVLDISVAGLIMLSIALGLLLFGRPNIVRSIRQTIRRRSLPKRFKPKAVDGSVAIVQQSSPSTHDRPVQMINDPAFLRHLVKEALQTILEAEMAAHLAAQPYERTTGRRGYRNGYKLRHLHTQIGTLELRMPLDREGTFSTDLFARYQRSEQALMLSLMEMYVKGVSTRKVAKVTEHLCGTRFTKGQVSALTGRLDEQYQSTGDHGSGHSVSGDKR